jgi:hypothetical protein
LDVRQEAEQLRFMLHQLGCRAAASEEKEVDSRLHEILEDVPVFETNQCGQAGRSSPIQRWNCP